MKFLFQHLPALILLFIMTVFLTLLLLGVIHAICEKPKPNYSIEGGVIEFRATMEPREEEMPTVITK